MTRSNIKHVLLPVLFLTLLSFTIGGYFYYVYTYCDLSPHNNGNCIDDHCLGDEVIIKQLGVEGYISDYHQWKPSRPIEYTITYKTDIGEAKTIVVRDFELIFKGNGNN